MQRVLVTGATGFLGVPVTRLLRARGWDVIAGSHSGHHDTVALDVLDSAAVQTVLADVRPTHLVHAAWLPVRGDVMRSAENLRWLAASLELVRCFHEAGGHRAAVVGSSAEYDWSEGICRNGVTPMRPATIYGTCKHALRVALEAYARATDLEFVWPRVFFVFGPGEHESRLVPSVVRSVVRGEAAELTHGRQVRDYLYVDDVARGIVDALESDHQGAVDIASGAGVAVRDLVAMVGQAMGGEHLLHFGARQSPSHDAPLVVGDPTEAAMLLGWAPATTLADGIAMTIAWGREAFGSPAPRGTCRDHDGRPETAR